MVTQSMSDLNVTDENREGTDHPDPILSQPIVAESNVPTGTPPETSRTGVTARIRVEHMSPSDKVSVRQRLEVDKENFDVDEEIFTPGFGSNGIVGIETGGPTKKTTRDTIIETPSTKRLRGHSVQTRTGDPVIHRTGGPLQTRTGDPVINRTGSPVNTRTGRPEETRTGCPVNASTNRTGCPMRARVNTGVSPTSQVETDPQSRTRIMSTSQVETDPQLRTIGSGANQADGLESLNGDILDQGPADRLGRSPWPGDSVSAVYPSPPNDIPSVSSSARANNGTDTIKDGPVATIKEAKGRYPSRVQVASTSTEETPTPVQVSQYLDILVILVPLGDASVRTYLYV